MAAGSKPVTCRNLRTKVFDEIQKKELASGSSKVDGTSMLMQLRFFEQLVQRNGVVVLQKAWCGMLFTEMALICSK